MFFHVLGVYRSPGIPGFDLYDHEHIYLVSFYVKRNSMIVNIYKILPLHDIEKNSKSSFSDFSYIIVVDPP